MAITREMGEEFIPFSPDDTGYKDNKLEGSFSLRSQIILDTRSITGQLPLDFDLYKDPSAEWTQRNIQEVLGIKNPPSPHRVNSVTPFDLTKGYRITSEDFRRASRLAKIESLRRSNALIILEPDEFPLTMFVTTKADYFINSGQAKKDESGFFGGFYNPNYLQALLNLRLQLLFPNWLTYESSPDELALQDEGVMLFMSYYPIETGPLADLSGTPYGFFRRGVSLDLPKDFNRLSQIKSRLIWSLQSAAPK